MAARKYTTLKQLVDAVASGEVDKTKLRFVVDNDSCWAYVQSDELQSNDDEEDDYEQLFGGCGAAYDPGPTQLAIDALALLGIEEERP